MPKGVYSNDRRKVWTAEDDMKLSDLIEAGRTVKQIAKAMGRSENSVKVRMSRTVECRRIRPMSARQVADALGVGCSKTVTRWMEQGWLNGRKGALGAGASRRWLVTEDALMSFIEDRAHWHRWDASRIADPYLREWAVELRNERYLTLGEVAARYFVVRGTVRKWIDEGRLPAVRNGNHMVPESALADFVPPSMSPKHIEQMRRFTADEDRLLMQLRWSDEHPWSVIAQRLGRSISSVAGRYDRLTSSAA